MKLHGYTEGASGTDGRKTALFSE